MLKIGPSAPLPPPSTPGSTPGKGRGKERGEKEGVSDGQQSIQSMDQNEHGDSVCSNITAQCSLLVLLS